MRTTLPLLALIYSYEPVSSHARARRSRYTPLPRRTHAVTRTLHHTQLQTGRTHRHTFSSPRPLTHHALSHHRSTSRTLRAPLPTSTTHLISGCAAHSLYVTQHIRHTHPLTPLDPSLRPRATHSQTHHLHAPASDHPLITHRNKLPSNESCHPLRNTLHHHHFTHTHATARSCVIFPRLSFSLTALLPSHALPIARTYN